MEKRNVLSMAMATTAMLMVLIVFTPAAMGGESSTEAPKNWEFNLAPFYIWASPWTVM